MPRKSPSYAYPRAAREGSAALRKRIITVTVAGALSAPVMAAPGIAAAPAAHAQVRHAATTTAAKKYVYLTFDDGPSRYTPKVLDILARYDVHGTFFELGENVDRYPSHTRRAHTEGNSVQNHTWSHPDLTKVSWSTFKSQVRRTDSVIRAQTGYTPQCLRPPYGAVDSSVRRRAASLDKTIVLWTVDPRDWSRPGTSVIVSRVLNAVRPGSTVLLHDGGGDRSQTVAALPTIVRTLKARGYTFLRRWCR